MSDKDRRDKPPDLRRHERFRADGEFHATLTDASGVKTDVVVRDVSAGGAGLTVKGAFENDDFVELHMGTFGRVSGRVARKFAEGVGVEFEMDVAERERFNKSLLAFRRAGGRKEF